MWILFAHGAGAPSSSPWMQRYKTLLEGICPVSTFDYDYMREGKKRPDPHRRLLDAHRRALVEGRRHHGPDVLLAGKSMGGRIGCHVALSEDVRGLVCFGYPLAGMGNPRKLRDQVLLDQDKPTLFVQGSRDTLCPLDLLGPVLDRRQGRSELHVVETGNHSLECTKTYLKQAGLTQDDIERDMMRRVAQFVASLG